MDEDDLDVFRQRLEPGEQRGSPRGTTRDHAVDLVEAEPLDDFGARRLDEPVGDDEDAGDGLVGRQGSCDRARQQRRTEQVVEQGVGRRA